MTAYLELADYLLIAEAVLGVPAELIADFNRIGLADSALAAPRAGFGGVEGLAVSSARPSSATGSPSAAGETLHARRVAPPPADSEAQGASPGPFRCSAKDVARAGINAPL